MKKISTTTTKAFRKMEKLTIGLDLGDRSNWYCVLDERGELVLEQKVSTTPKAIEEVFGGMPRSRSQTLGTEAGRTGWKERKERSWLTARKLAVLLHRLWVNGEVYEPFHSSSRRTLVAAA